MEQKPVKLFALTTCIHCNKLKKFLQKHNIKFEWTDIDLLPESEQEVFFEQTKEHNPKKSFPIVIIGNMAIVGDQRELIVKELGIVDEP